NLYYSFQKLDRSWTQTQTLEQNLPISVVGQSGQTTYYPAVDPNTLAWRQAQVWLDANGTRIIILYGDLIMTVPSPLNKPARAGNADIDAYNHMIYDSLLFAEVVESSGYRTSLVPLWTLGSTLGRNRANLKIKPSAEQ